MDIEKNNEILEEDEGREIITLTSDSGEDVEFEFLDVIEFEGVEYIVLLPLENSDDDVVILEVEPVNEEEDNLLGVRDERILQEVFAIFKERFKDEFTFLS